MNAALPMSMYRLLIYHSSMQRTEPRVHFLAVPQLVGAEAEIRPLQLTATQLQWTMNAALLLKAFFYISFHIYIG